MRNPHTFHLFKMTTGVILGVLLLLLITSMVSAEIVVSARWIFYHPVDSTIYFTSEAQDPESMEMGSYVFRLKDHGQRIERSERLRTDFSGSLSLTAHDNLPNRIYAFARSWEDDAVSRLFLVSEDGGETWRDSPGPNSYYNSPGERQGESYRMTPVNNELVLHRTEDSWATWDTSDVVQNWNWHDNIILFTRNNGCLIQYDRDNRDQLAFSNDYGQSWISGEIEGDLLPGPYVNVGTGEEFYCRTSPDTGRYFCVRDSGRNIQEVFNFSQHGDYAPDELGHGWSKYIITTPNPGEFYAIAKKISCAQQWIFFHVYHCTNYGENVGDGNWYDLLVDPVSVAQSGLHLPTTPIFQNYPNPFNSTTNIRFTLPGSDWVSLKLYTPTGRELTTLANGFMGAGNHEISWDGTGFNSGVYFVTLTTSQGVSGRSVVLVK
ncbi:MAG: T9SS type A sorting domain-containing protein [Calditrichaeota bacterium]|nr:T9SS type A sorting domain-containing protein [Calditrichota bacterium]